MINSIAHCISQGIRPELEFHSIRATELWCKKCQEYNRAIVEFSVLTSEGVGPPEALSICIANYMKEGEPHDLLH